MKKRVSAELISIAHRILKLKNHSDTIQLQQEAKNLYDQLTILRFYEENFELVKNEILQEVLEEKLETKLNSIAVTPVEEVKEEELVVQTPVFEEPIVAEKVVIAELIVEEDEAFESESEPIVSVKEQAVETPVEPVSAVIGTQAKQISFEDMLVHDYAEMDFVKVEDVPVEVEIANETVFEPVVTVEEVIKAEVTPEVEAIFESPKALEQEMKATFEKVQESKTSSLNDRLNKSIAFGLNDRIGFEKKLFAGSSDDFNRVISQLNTFDNFDEARSFVQDFVKPDYNNWEGKEEFENRFMEIVEKKFS